MTESLAFNIMARIDDLLYVDDASKQRATAESPPPRFQGKCGSRPSKQKWISSGHASLQHGPCSSAFTVPTAGSSSEVIRISNGRKPHSLKKSNLRDSLDQTLEKLTF